MGPGTGPDRSVSGVPSRGVERAPVGMSSFRGSPPSGSSTQWSGQDPKLNPRAHPSKRDNNGEAQPGAVEMRRAAQAHPYR